MSHQTLVYAAWAALNIAVAREVNIAVREPYMDEPFHIPQAQAYCDGEWSSWDPKITTPPGLYVLSVIMKRIIMARCTIPTLRFTNIVLLLFLPIPISHLLAHVRRVNPPRSLLAPTMESLVIASFPIVWFFAFLYYTELGSLLFVVSTIWAARKRSHLLAAVLGLISCTFRQTNIAWILYAFGSTSLYDLHWIHRYKTESGNELKSRLHDPKARDATTTDVVKSVQSLIPLIPRVLSSSLPYIMDAILFAAFVIWNGGIVLGDKSNHIPVLHFPQAFYFIAFSTMFGFPVLISGSDGPLGLAKNVWSRMFGSVKRIAISAIIMLGMLVSIKLYTIHHPFLLSDNRHYTFYVWRRIFMFHPIVPYLFAPGYLACFWAWFLRIGETSTLLETLLLPLCLLPTLLPTPLLEPRYFLIPYILLRTRVSHPRPWALALEAVWYIAINWATMWVFIYAPREGGSIRFMW
ncbi:glucosyltransferase [Tulasnella sp. 419]|nr:glucosyltransferase [Tulasnella sp. 419]